jgi:hypothetical protein
MSDNASNPLRQRLGRRSMLSGGLASLVGGLVSIRVAASQSPDQEPEPDACNTLFLPQVQVPGEAVVNQNLSLLPATAAGAYYKQKLAADPEVQIFAKYFTQRSMSIQTENIHLFMGIRPYAAETEELPTTPFLLAIIPAAQPVVAGAASHEAASIIILREREVNTVLAGAMVVSHQPYQIQAFQVIELDPASQELTFRRLDRNQIESLSAEQLAEALRIPTLIIDDWDYEIGGLGASDTETLSALAYRNLLQASFDQGVYPPEGLRSLVADSPLVQKLAVAQGLRYQEAVGRRGNIACSTSTTCSCHGCTTSSSSSKKINQVVTPTAQ